MLHVAIRVQPLGERRTHAASGRRLKRGTSRDSSDVLRKGRKQPFCGCCQWPAAKIPRNVASYKSSSAQGGDIAVAR